MSRIRIMLCWSLGVIILAGGAPCQAAFLEFLSNPTRTIADLRRSYVRYVKCTVGGNPLQRCIKVLWDPPEFIQDGIMTVDIDAPDGDVSRIGNVQSVTFFNGYTGAGPFRRIDGVDTVRFEIPVVSVERPSEALDAVDIVELLVAETGGDTENKLLFKIGGQDVIVNPGQGLPPVPAEVIGKTEFLGYNVPLTTDQEVPPPVFGAPTPVGSAVVNVDPASGEIRISGEYLNMTSDVIAAHLHGPAPVGAVAPPLFALNTSGGTEGTFAGDSFLSPDALDQLFAGLTYINVHTGGNPAGEIRGQVLIPEPSAMTLLACGLLGVAGYRRRRE